MQNLDKEFWDLRWQQGTTGWDIGYASPALITFMESYPNKSAKILIPGCGNAYEAEELINMGYTNIDIVDISPKAVANLTEKFRGKNAVHSLCCDFFELKGPYDLILEQTFFCALDPGKRRQYVQQCHDLLNPEGVVAGLLFATAFAADGPPFGGDADEYRELFSAKFQIRKLDNCYNSIPKRAGNELFFILVKM
ncbi:MAG: methyltransferase domain-containing protein [Saprospiraceae bacterium]|nr:methyltransferase domain-containing protein [Saprospiraceae bacterium]